MITNIINKMSFIIFCLGICSADTDNLLIPVSMLIVSGVLFKLTEEESID